MAENDLEAMTTAAREVALAAYAPASNFPVGAALLAEDGRVFVGCNVENASYGLTICAERNAVGHAIAAGARRFVRCVIHTPLDEPASPCGACRQVLAEFAGARTGAEDPDMEIVLVGNGAASQTLWLSDLLPHPFRFDRF